LVDVNFVNRAHAAGLLVNVWTVDDPERMVELIEIGVDGICTNVPDVARSIIDQRG
ncbi:MAG: glycerophosphodiester phosphodiesterase, partial [Acidimicrobiaceae bacterium]|nr:glycerophosphodiester phosphodiesterase [Acidimicrobiaceae bacterium]